jgi:hypothetical protein
VPQLNPAIPVDTPKGRGYAIWRELLSQEHDTLWTVIIDETGQFWDFPQPLIRAQPNSSMGRRSPERLSSAMPKEAGSRYFS